MELLEQKKNIYSISVQDITTRATVNRSTFYAHFEDKYAFLEYWMREKFQKIIQQRLPEDLVLNRSSLRTLIQAVFDFLIRFRQYMTPGDKEFEPMFETAMQKEVYQILLKWLTERSGGAALPERAETIANFLSWGIFGSAMQYSRSSQDLKADRMVESVLEVAEISLVAICDYKPSNASD